MQTLTETREGAVATVRLNRPEVHNAFNEVSISELDQTFRRLDADSEVRVVVLAGRGKSFCAGADIDWMKGQAETTDEQNRASANRMATLFETIDCCSKPVIARIHGAALGGGSGLVCAVDIALAGPKALFGFTEVRLGIIPAVISPFVVRRLGFAAARARFLTGSRFGPEEALRIGLVHVVAEDLDAEVERNVQALLRGAAGAHAATKALIRTIWDTPHNEQKALTVEATSRARASEEGRAGLGAFLRKERPPWHPG